MQLESFLKGSRVREFFTVVNEWRKNFGAQSKLLRKVGCTDFKNEF